MTLYVSWLFHPPVLYVLCALGGLVSSLLLFSLWWPQWRLDRVALAVPLFAVGFAVLGALADLTAWLAPSIYPRDPSLCALSGLAVLSVLLALAALGRPARRALHIASALTLVATIAGYAWITADIRASMLEDLFFRQDGGTRVRAALEITSVYFARGMTREILALCIAAVATLLATPLLAAARVRARVGGRPWGWKALACAAGVLPLLTASMAALHYVTASTRNTCHMVPMDRSLGLEEMWTHLAELRITIVVAGFLAAALGSLVALRASRSGHVVDNRGLCAALAIFVLGGGLYLSTRDHAEDTAKGPRAAFVGEPYEPFGAVASHWTFADFVDPPEAPSKCPLHYEVDDIRVVPLEINATGELVVPFDDLDIKARGVAAWKNALREQIEYSDYVVESRGGSPQSLLVGANIDRAAPLARVLPYLEAAEARGVEKVLLFSRRAVIQSTRTLGDVQVDKVCVFGSLRLGGGLAPAEELATWGDLSRVAAALAPGPLVVGSASE